MNIDKIFKKTLLKKALQIVKYTSFIVLLLYIIFAFYVSVSLNVLISDAINNKPYQSCYKGINITENDYISMNPIQAELEENLTVAKKSGSTIPFVLPFFTDAHYVYTYIVTDANTGECIYGSFCSHVTIELDINIFKINVLNVEEAP